MKIITDYIEQIVYNSRAEANFRTAWSSYSIRDYSEIFLPFAPKYAAANLNVVDAALLFPSFAGSAKSDTDNVYNLTFYAVAADSEAHKNKELIAVRENEILVLITVTDTQHATIAYKTGQKFIDSIAQTDPEQTGQVREILNTTTELSVSDLKGKLADVRNNLTAMKFLRKALGLAVKNSSLAWEETLDAYLPATVDGVLFDAGSVRKTDPDSWGHYDIEYEGLKAAGFDKWQVRAVYYGNWLRDYSSVITAASIGFGQIDQNILRRNPQIMNHPVVRATKDSVKKYLTQNCWIHLIQMLTVKEFCSLLDDTRINYQDLSDRFLKEFDRVGKEALGVYRPEEHIDNPRGMMDESVFSKAPLKKQLVRYNYEDYKGHVVTKTLYPGELPLPADYYTTPEDERPAMPTDIDWDKLMKYYIKTDFTHRPSTFTYFSQQIRLAVKYGRTKKGYMHLGGALHVLEDYYAHSNFVELLLMKHQVVGIDPHVTLSDEVAAMQDGPAKANKIPIVTGRFATPDLFASLAPKLAEMLFPLSTDYKRLKYNERTMMDWAIPIILQDFIDREDNLGVNGNKKFTLYGLTYQDILDGFNTYLAVRSKVLYYQDKIIPDWLEDLLGKTTHFLVESLTYYPKLMMHLIFGTVPMLVELKQNASDYETDPTHTQLAKDSADHPLNPLAGYLAKLAVKKVGNYMSSCWNAGSGQAKDNKATELIQFADAHLFVHPKFSDFHDADLLNWLKSHNKPTDKVADRLKKFVDSHSDMKEFTRKYFGSELPAPPKNPVPSKHLK